MARRKALSAELDPRVRQLLTELRRLTDQGELSMRLLAARTGYSQKSWERYLGGRSLPPREAVEALARTSGVDPVRLLALHEVATAVWAGGRTNAPPPHEPPPAPETTTEPVPPPARPGTESAEPVMRPARPGTESTPPGTESAGPGTAPAQAGSGRFPERSLRVALVALVAGVVALALAAVSAVLLVMRLNDNGGGEPAAAPPVLPTTGGSSRTPAYHCRIQRTDGLWYAGISRTRDAELAYGSAGPDVAEAQCLLRRAGISPGGIDGLFGPLTQRAVKAMQKRSGLDEDGVVGSRTWQALRG
ncbi:peptidoglycan-binding protein [Streptomyces sp. NPDC060000]|uniref:peptidoglycan-binding protein n=1 Tax=Streptomyces sp. NPDC060000 TaxID=3347031 RepID=UPI0036C877B2